MQSIGCKNDRSVTSATIIASSASPPYVTSQAKGREGKKREREEEEREGCVQGREGEERERCVQGRVKGKGREEKEDERYTKEGKKREGTKEV